MPCLVAIVDCILVGSLHSLRQRHGNSFTGELHQINSRYFSRGSATPPFDSVTVPGVRTPSTNSRAESGSLFQHIISMCVSLIASSTNPLADQYQMLYSATEKQISHGHRLEDLEFCGTKTSMNGPATYRHIGVL